MLPIASCVSAVQVCSNEQLLLAEIMAKKLMQDQSKLFSSGTNIQNSYL